MEIKIELTKNPKENHRQKTLDLDRFFQTTCS